MSLCVESSCQYDAPCRDGEASFDCACDREKLGVVRAYMREQFPDRVVREFHSRSTVVAPGRRPAPCADHHVVSISDERPDRAVG